MFQFHKVRLKGGGGGGGSAAGGFQFHKVRLKDGVLPQYDIRTDKVSIP